MYSVRQPDELSNKIEFLAKQGTRCFYKEIFFLTGLIAIVVIEIRKLQIAYLAR